MVWGLGQRGRWHSLSCFGGSFALGLFPGRGGSDRVVDFVDFGFISTYVLDSVLWLGFHLPVGLGLVSGLVVTLTL